MRAIVFATFILFAATFALLATDTHLPDTAGSVAHYRAAMAAADSGNTGAYESRMRAAVELAPGQPVMMFHLARALALEGHGDEAVKWLARVVATGADPGIADNDAFASLRGRDDFKAVVADAAARRTPIGRPEVALRLEVGDMLPEGIAWDPDDESFFLSSVRHREVVRVARGRAPERFAAPDDMYGALGLFVDSDRSDLWVVSTMMPGVEGYTEGTDGNCAVHRFDIVSGNVERAYQLIRADGRHSLADIAVSPGGIAYVTDSAEGTIYTVDPNGDDRLLELIGPGELRGPNGIALSGDGRLLYVSQYAWGLAVVDIAARTWMPLAHPDDVATFGVDGLYAHDGALVGIQNYAGLSQVTRFQLSGDGRSIVSARVIVRHDEHMDDPTTGAFVGDDFYFIANSQLPRVRDDGSVPPSNTFDDTFILRTVVE